MYQFFGGVLTAEQQQAVEVVALGGGGREGEGQRMLSAYLRNKRLVVMNAIDCL